MFENDVEMYGAQTLRLRVACVLMFENDVEMYGAQTYEFFLNFCNGLRMM